jgi:hypothetical protein
LTAKRKEEEDEESESEIDQVFSFVGENIIEVKLERNSS